MEQEKINYDEIMALDFKEEIQNDKIYFAKNGYDYTIITKKLTKKIYLDWDKETKLCELIRIDSPKKCNIKSKMPIMNLNHLKEIINFFNDEKEQAYDYTAIA